MHSIWRLEGLVVLAWALGQYELPSHDALVVPNDLWKKLGLFDKERGLAILSDPTLRSRDELESQRKRLLAIHWRLREYDLRPEAMDFVEFGQKCWFGPFDVSVFSLKDGDLCLNGERIDEASQDQFVCAHSAALERHLAINWLCDGPDRYADASVAT